MTVRVEPGVVLDQLNAHLKPLGLMFGPDVSTSDRATIGGMIGNNSAGARSLRTARRSTTSAPSRSCCPTARPRRSARSPSRARRRLRADRHRRAAPTARSATTSPHTGGDRGAIPEDPPAGQRLQPRRIRSRPAGPPRGVGRRPLAVQPRPADRRLGGDARRGTAAELKVVPIPKAQGLVVLSFATIPAASTAWPRSWRPGRWPSRCSTG